MLKLEGEVLVFGGSLNIREDGFPCPRVRLRWITRFTWTCFSSITGATWTCEGWLNLGRIWILQMALLPYLPSFLIPICLSPFHCHVLLTPATSCPCANLPVLAGARMPLVCRAISLWLMASCHFWKYLIHPNQVNLVLSPVILFLCFCSRTALPLSPGKSLWSLETTRTTMNYGSTSWRGWIGCSLTGTTGEDDKGQPHVVIRIYWELCEC